MYYIKYQQVCLRAREGEKNVAYSTLHTSPKYFPAIKGRISQLKLEEYNSSLHFCAYPWGICTDNIHKTGLLKNNQNV